MNSTAFPVVRSKTNPQKSQTDRPVIRKNKTIPQGSDLRDGRVEPVPVRTRVEVRTKKELLNGVIIRLYLLHVSAFTLHVVPGPIVELLHPLVVGCSFRI